MGKKEAREPYERTPQARLTRHSKDSFIQKPTSETFRENRALRSVKENFVSHRKLTHFHKTQSALRGL